MKAHTVLAKVKKSEERRGIVKEPGETAAREEEAKVTEPATAPSSDSLRSSKSDSLRSSDLTSRLQKLALERQKQNRHETLRVIQSDATSHLHSAKTFQELRLPDHLLTALFEMGFERPSAIQEEALPRILADPPRNVIGQAQSGSGKTAAFVLGMLYRIVVEEKHVQALCVTPTRELAIQIFQNAVKPMASHMEGLRVRLALSGETVEKGVCVEDHLVIGEYLRAKRVKTSAASLVTSEASN
jgi:ATP-dependent RNA helicase DDX19/DBP5